MSDERRKLTERRLENRAVLEDMKKQVDEVHHRVYNGLGLELRKEVKDEIGGVRNLFIGILIAMILSLSAIVVEGRVSANQASSENDRNYRAILEIGSKLENHIIITGAKP